MTCLIYVRVSTDKQAEKELSLPAQLGACRQLAHERGWQVLEEFIEPGASARTADRPELTRLLGRCRAASPPIAAVIVHKLDRLARNLADHVAIRAVLEKAGTKLVSVSENVDDSVSGQLVENIMAAIAQFYSANLAEEVKKGMRQKVLTGGWPHQVPRGYRIEKQGEKSTIMLDESDGRLVRQAFELCSVGYRGVLDLRRRLAALGFLSKTGQPLSNDRLLSLLRNPFYCGRMRWNGSVYPGTHPALISPQLFDRVQLVLKSRSRRVNRRPLRFLLSGLARCAECGSYMGGERHKQIEYYRCRGAFRLDRPCRARYCRSDLIHRHLAREYRRLVPTRSQRQRLLQRIAAAERTALGERQLVELRQQIRSASSALALHVALPLQAQRWLAEILIRRLVIDHTGVVRWELDDSIDELLEAA